ncbi:hypothetical protein L596_009111 [Steinernema carpocapsae]|uniref:Uncharacterized protein n=1 Tax=Steinernema carpocapsae TaxID=34508 RepID=A0A4U5PEF1_STECR|nr:hypothetical protein L596_009111 [Steinernema carpocapsae]
MFARVLQQAAAVQVRNFASKSGSDSISRSTMESMLQKGKDAVSDTSFKMKATLFKKPTTEQKVAKSVKGLADKVAEKVGGVRERTVHLKQTGKHKSDEMREKVAQKVHKVGRKISK